MARMYKIAALLCALTVPSAIAFSSYQSNIPNGGSVPGHPGLGHTNLGGGGARNSFGAAFAAAGRSWTSDLCNADSDNDGFTNGQELGDPQCVWTTGATPARTTGISDPSLASSTPDTLTAAPPTTAAPPLTKGALIVTSDTGSFLGGKMTVSWSAFENDVIELTFTTSGSFYAGFGLADAAMNGPIITCFVDTTNGGQCSLWTGSNLAITVRTGAMAVLSSSLLGSTGGFNITVSTTLSGMGATRGKQRAIVATGTYNANTNRPSQHAGSDRNNAAVDIFAGTANSKDSYTYRIVAIIIVLVVMIVCLVVAAAMNFAKIVLGPNVNLAAMLALSLIFVGLVAMFVGLAHIDHDKNVADVAVGRAFGDAALMCLWFVLWPVPKIVNVGRLAGTSFERMLSYHVLVALVFALIATIHFIVMLATLDNASERVTKWEGDIPPLAGLLAWICLMIIVLVALFARRLAYWFHRIIHCGFILVFVFACLHYKPAIFSLIPPLLVWVMDVVARLYRTLTTKVEIARATYDEAGQFTHLVLHVPGVPEPQPAQFALVSISYPSECGLHSANSHPISVAWFDTAAHEAHFFVKSQGPSSWSGKLGRAALQADFCTRGKVAWTGAYGDLQVPLGKTGIAVLVAGGVGITPCLHILQQVSKGYNKTAVKQVVLLWSVRDGALFAAVQPLLVEALAAASAVGVAARVDIFMTGKQGPASEPLEGVKGLAVQGRRMNLEKDVNTAMDVVAGSGWASEPVAVYACGPEPIMDAAAQFAGGLKQGLFHSETFNL